MELPNGFQAHLRLGTIYQKLGDLVRSDEALKKVIAAKGLDPQDLAEAPAAEMSSSRRFRKT